MADVPDKQDGGSIPGGDGAPDWPEIDAHVNSGEESPATGSPQRSDGVPHAADAGRVSDGADERAPVDTGGLPEISQEDIDTLLQAAGGSPTPVIDTDSLAGPPMTPLDDMAGADFQMADESQLNHPSPPPSTFASPPLTETFDLEELSAAIGGAVDLKRVTMLNDVNLNVKIELGRTRMLVEDVLKLGEGSVVELDKLAGDPVDVYVNGRLIARGEVLVLNDNFCVRISEVLGNDPHRVSA